MERQRKTLKLTVYLWTDGLPEGADCHPSGIVYIPISQRKTANGKGGTIFNSTEGMGDALLKELAAAGLIVAPIKEKEA